MAGLNSRVGLSIKKSEYLQFKRGKALAAKLFNKVAAKTCHGNNKCHLVATSFGDECTTCKTIQ